MISCVVFDFDDTLIWSEKYKIQAFFDIAENFENGIEKMQCLVNKPERSSRYKVMEDFAKSIGRESLAQSFSLEYTNKVEKYLQEACDPVDGAEEALYKLKQKGFTLYINSATPEKTLKKTIVKIGWANFFNGIYGEHNQKLANLKKIAEKEKLLPQNIVMVGDGESDRESAESFGCMFIGLEQGLAKYKKSVKLVIKDMNELVTLITEANFER